MGKIKEMNELWKEMRIQLAKNPKLKIPCPNCSHEYVQVLDVEAEIKSDPTLFERIIFCPNCGGKIYLRMHHEKEE